jgi:hypothetical protein
MIVKTLHMYIGVSVYLFVFCFERFVDLGQPGLLQKVAALQCRKAT